MPRPSTKHRANGLTRTDVARQLRCSPSYVRKLQKRGYLPEVRDGSGIFRFSPHDVAELARKLGRVVQTDGETASRIYGHFLEPGFRGTPEQLGRVVHETSQGPDVVLTLWLKFKLGAGSPVDEEAREMDRLAREYDEQIAAMDEAIERKRRAVFIPSDAQDETPPSSR
jgi:hypothetical protein